LRIREQARKLLGWPKICKLAHAFRWEHSCKRLKLAQLLGQLWIVLTTTGRSSPADRADLHLQSASQPDCVAGNAHEGRTPGPKLHGPALRSSPAGCAAPICASGASALAPAALTRLPPCGGGRGRHFTAVQRSGTGQGPRGQGGIRRLCFCASDLAQTKS
jgi:hypothetical protein